jgi:hypothetical protein
MSTIRKWTWTVVRLVILVFLVAGIIDIFMITSGVFLETVQTGATFSNLSDRIQTKIQRPGQPYDPYQSLVTNTSLAENIIRYKRLHIDVDPHQVIVSYDV